MRRARWLLCILGVGGLALGLAYAQKEPTFKGTLLSNEWYYQIEAVGPLLSEPQAITGLAFSPGGGEVAVCWSEGGSSGLALATAQPALTWLRKSHALGRGLWSKEDAALVRKGPPAPGHLRRLWTAPEGVALVGAPSWFPDGSAIVVYAVTESSRDFVAVDLASKQAAWLTRGARVGEVVWAPQATRFAYTAAEEGGEAVWLRSLSSDKPQRLGAGGARLGWSDAGAELRWFAPASNTEWTEMTWTAATEITTTGATRPAPPAGALWSPDGRWYALLQGSQLLLFGASSNRGQPVDTGRQHIKRLLGWSPDGNLLVGVNDGGFPVLIAAQPLAKGDFRIAYATHVLSRGETALVLPFPMDPAAGPPAWTSETTALLYQAAAGEETPTAGKPVVFNLSRQYVYLAPGPRAETERRLVLSNMKQLSLALRMYGMGNDDQLPPTNDDGAVQQAMGDWVYGPSVFMRIGSNDEVVVHWLFDPTQKPLEEEEAAKVPVAIITYLPDYDAIAYLDGHAELVPKRKE